MYNSSLHSSFPLAISDYATCGSFPVISPDTLDKKTVDSKEISFRYL